MKSCKIGLFKKFIFGQSLEPQGTLHNSFINVSDVCYIRYATFSHQRHRRLRSVTFEFFFQIWNIFLRNVWYIFVGGEIPNYGQYPFECTCSWISCTNIWISRSSMLNPELESFSAQRHLKRFIHVIELTNRISDIWDVQGQNQSNGLNLALIVRNNLFQNVVSLLTIWIKKIHK